MADYKHGTYGEFAESIGAVATQSGTVAVYVLMIVSASLTLYLA